MTVHGNNLHPCIREHSQDLAPLESALGIPHWLLLGVERGVAESGDPLVRRDPRDRHKRRELLVFRQARHRPFGRAAEPGGG